MRSKTCPSQVNARKIYDEADVLGGILDNNLFLGILGAEAALQVVTCLKIPWLDNPHVPWRFHVSCTADEVF